MRHHNANRKFGLEKGKRRAFKRALVRALVMEERITTTIARAKELKSLTEKLITVAKKQDKVNSMRTLVSRMGGQQDVAKKIVETYAPRYADRKGGYTRVYKLPQRVSDGAPMAIIEFV